MRLREPGVSPYPGTGGQSDFVRTANRSRGGKAFIVLRSTAKNERISRIVSTPWETPGLPGAQDRAEVWIGGCAIQMVSQLIGSVGGGNIFPELGVQRMGRDRVISDSLEPARRAPDLIVGSWCGKKFRAERVASRPGWQDAPTVSSGRLHEIKSCDIPCSPGRRH